MFYSAFVWKCTDLSNHRFGVQLLQNPPLSSSTVKVCRKHVYLDGGQGVGESAAQCRGNFLSGAKQDDSKQGLASSDPYSLLQFTVAGENTKIIPNVLLIVHCVLALIIGYKKCR